LTKYRQIAAIGSFVCFLGFIICFWITEKDYEATGNEQVEALGVKYTTKEIIRSLLIMKNFWRYVALIWASFGCRFAYRMLDAALPKYMERTLGEGSMYGTVLMTNPMANLVFAPLLTPLVYLYSNYT